MQTFYESFCKQKPGFLYWRDRQRESTQLPNNVLLTWKPRQGLETKQEDNLALVWK